MSVEAQVRQGEGERGGESKGAVWCVSAVGGTERSWVGRANQLRSKRSPGFDLVRFITDQTEKPSLARPPCADLE